VKIVKLASSLLNRIRGVLVSMIVPSVVDRGFKTQLSQS